MDLSSPQLARKLSLENRARLLETAKTLPTMKARFLAGPPATTPQECLARHDQSFSLTDPIFDQVAPCSRENCACTWAPNVFDNPHGFKRTVK